MSEERFDVIEVQINKPHAIRLIATDKGKADARAIVDMAVSRRGVETHYFTAAAAGKYRDGDHHIMRTQKNRP